MRALFITVALAAMPALASAQPGVPTMRTLDGGVEPNPEVVCGLPVPKPAQSPPEGSEPMTAAVMLCFDKQGGVPSIEPQTYLYYIQFRASEPSRGRWVRYDAEAERTLLADFRRLWETNFLDDLSIEALDYRFDNGVPGKLIVFHLEERRRLKIVDYDGLTHVTRSDINDRLKERGIDLRLDSFVDDGQLRRAASVIKELYAEKGYRDAHVTSAIRALDGGPKIARVVFTIAAGPKIAIRDVEFIGNRVFGDDVLARRLKANKARGLLALVSGGGAFNEEKFADDAQAIVEHYRNHGYIEAQVGAPQLRTLDDSPDGMTRWVQLRVDVNEGRRFQLGTFTIAGNSVLRSEALLPLFEIDEGDVYDEQRIRKGLERARELYGSGGYFEFTAYPDLKPRDQAAVPTVDVTLRVSEGAQYFIGRIEFAGNTHTLDSVIRREIGLVEGGVFNTEALKYSIKRINQLGYFKPLDDKALDVDRAPGTQDKVNVKVTVEEQNRNQLTFGAGASQYDGFFANFSYTTSNFLGRGESLTASLQTGTRSRNYQLSFSEPFLFGRAITAGGSAYSRKVDYMLTAATIDYSEVRSGFNLTSGVPWKRFSRLFMTYGYEIVDTAMTADLRTSLNTSTTPFLMEDGRFIESSITPSFVHNTIDNPFAPRSGKRLTLTYQYAGGLLGGTSDFVRPEVEGILYVPLTGRTALGLRANAGKIWNFGRGELPYYRRYFLGGEMQIRGVDVRTVGPLNENNAALGGTSFVLFNAEYYVDILPQVRALAFHDAGQAFDDTRRADLRQLRTSSGLELRVTLPVINVPFRLIYAWNIYRDTFQPARGFRFAVGTTF
jgi:outer membrane protein insertion porin family